jgi:hypothetical protein
MPKTFRYQCGIGTAKYLVSFHDGVKTHKDGSPFFDVRIFKNKKALALFVKSLKQSGYIER